MTTGEQATFRCQHIVADIVYWRFDGNTVGSNPPSGVSRSTSEEGDSTVLVLIVYGFHEYNGSVVECVAAFFNGSSEVSDPAYLTGTYYCSSKERNSAYYLTMSCALSFFAI